MTNDTRLNSTTIARKCACKGWIIAPENVSAFVAEKVAEHQLTEQHRNWNHRAWQQNNTVNVDVPIVKLRRVA